MKNYKYLLTTFFPLHILLVSLFFFVDYNFISLLYFLAGYIFIGGYGVAIGLHRWASHRSIILKSWAENLIIYASVLSCQGHPIWWAAVHRGYHHRFADTEKDEHSPIFGRWHAFVGWILKHNPTNVNYKFAVDLLRNKKMAFTAKYYEVIILLSWIILGLIDLNLLYWFAIVQTIVAFHGEVLINTFCHSDNVGYRNFETKDKSRNVPILGLMFWGNGWHNNHHQMPSSFDFGKSVSGKKWEFDTCTLLSHLIKK